MSGSAPREQTPQHRPVVVRQPPAAHQLHRLVALAGDQHHIALARHLPGGPDRLRPTRDLDALGAPTGLVGFIGG